MLVVLFHYVVLQQNAHLVPAPLVWLNDAMAPFRMPLLMVLSGLFVPASLRHGPWRFVTRRLAGVAWPLVVWSLMSWGIQVVAANGSAALSSPVESLLSTRLAAPAGVWFLAYLLVFSAIALLTRRLPPTIVAVGAWSISLVTPRVGTDPEIDRFFVLLAFFMGGVALTRLPSRLIAVARTPQAVVVSAVAAAACVAIAVARGTAEVHYLPIMAPAVAVGMIAIVRAAQALQHRRVSRLLAVVGRRSVVYYLSHFVGLAMAVAVTERVGATSLSWTVLGIGLSFGVGVALHALVTVVPPADILFRWPTRTGSRAWRRRASAARSDQLRVADAGLVVPALAVEPAGGVGRGGADGVDDAGAVPVGPSLDVPEEVRAESVATSDLGDHQQQQLGRG